MTQFVLLILWISFSGESGAEVNGFTTKSECIIAKTLIGNPPNRFDIHYYYKDCIEVRFSQMGEEMAWLF